MAEEPKEPKEPREPPGPPPPGTKRRGGVILPRGMTLVRVANPAGSDAKSLFYLSGKVNGINMSFEVGDRAALKALFGDRLDQAMEQLGITHMSQSAFDEDYVVMGTSDEIEGATESLQAQIERDIRSLGGQLPEWMRNSKKAMTIQAIGAREGWSPQKIAGELAKTDAFKRRYSAFGVVAEAMGTSDVLSVTNQIASMEASIRESIRTYRGPDARVDERWLQRLIGTGWSAGELDTVLAAERRMRDTPDAWKNFNAIREFRGEDPLTRGQFAQVLAGSAPRELLESVNDALRQSALAHEGIKIGRKFAEALGSGSGELESAGSLQARAQQVARAVLEFGLELDVGKFGLKRNDIIRAAFDGEGTQEVLGVLEKFGRERAEAAGGYASSQGFLDDEGRLRVMGLKGL